MRSAKRISRGEGYPIHQTTPPGRLDALLSRPYPCPGASSRDGLLRAMDAASRPERPVLLAYK